MCWDYPLFQYFQAYQKQIKDLNRQVKKLEEEKDLIKLDVDARYGENLSLVNFRLHWHVWHWSDEFKDVFGSFLFSIEFFYIYIYCRKFNAEFNKLIKSVGQCASCFEKWCWTHPPLPTILTLFGYFHILTYQVLKL